MPSAKKSKSALNHRRRTLLPWWPIIGLAVAATTLYVLIGLGSFRGFSLGMDLGIFDQAVRAYSHFQTPYIQIKAQGGFNILGDHFSPILMLLAPFYWLWPDARMLMCAQAVLFGFSVGFVGWYAHRRGLGLAAYLVEASLACSYGVLAATIFDFHEIAFGLPVLLWALWAFLERRDGHLIAACIVMCLIKEDMPMYSAGIALAMFFTGRRLYGVILGVASAAVTLLLIFVVIPYFSYSGHYAYIGGGARGLRSLNAALTTFGQHLLSWQGITFILLIIATAGIGMRRPLMLVVIPTVLFRLMANDTVYLGFHLQYGVLLTGVAFMAVIDGWAWMTSRHTQWAQLLKVAQVGLLLLGALGGFFGSRASVRVNMLHGFDGVLAEKTQIQNQIPNGANVAADVYLVPQIVDRTTVQVAYASWTDETGAPIRADYVFLDTGTISYSNALS
ncbi:MAG: DUF2079 domain-containing protein, partial [Propionibacteriaceae bacterium]|nr:DUF2079 domain-containing protein [Propionibacteriaceae bacterium]